MRYVGGENGEVEGVEVGGKWVAVCTACGYGQTQVLGINLSRSRGEM